MNDILSMMVIALFIEAITQIFKPVWDKSATPLTVPEWLSMLIGIFIAVAARINMLDGMMQTIEGNARFAAEFIEKELKCAVEVFRSTESAHRCMGNNLVASGCKRTVFIEEKRLVLKSCKETGSNGIYADSHLGEMNCKPLRKVGNCSLSAAVCRNLCKRAESIHRRNIDDAAARLLCHIFSKYLCRNKGTEEVEVKYKGNACRIKVKECLDT